MVWEFIHVVNFARNFHTSCYSWSHTWVWKATWIKKQANCLLPHLIQVLNDLGESAFEIEKTTELTICRTRLRRVNANFYLMDDNFITRYLNFVSDRTLQTASRKFKLTDMWNYVRSFLKFLIHRDAKIKICLRSSWKRKIDIMK